MTTITRGSCLCGNVSYEVVGDLRPICLCHCSQCRKASGHYTAATSAPISNITIEGASLKWFDSSTYARRGFCDSCGSSLFYEPLGEKRLAIFCGSIDGDPGVSIDSQIFVEEKGDYYATPDVKVVNQSELGWSVGSDDAG
ncbi:MAG: GFA family protein [Halieaceae bacterium]|nr:GFA family protein [Halieaceae bacterium]